MENKLELKHLAAYLPYEVKVKRIDTHKASYRLTAETINTVLSNKVFRLILRPLADYVNINGPAMGDLNCDISTQINLNELAIKYISVGELDFSTVEICLENHIDIFNLIDKGRAVPLT